MKINGRILDKAVAVAAAGTILVALTVPGFVYLYLFWVTLLLMAVRDQWFSQH